MVSWLWIRLFPVLALCFSHMDVADYILQELARVRPVLDGNQAGLLKIGYWCFTAYREHIITGFVFELRRNLTLFQIQKHIRHKLFKYVAVFVCFFLIIRGRTTQNGVGIGCQMFFFVCMTKAYMALVCCHQFTVYKDFDQCAGVNNMAAFSDMDERNRVVVLVAR